MAIPVERPIACERCRVSPAVHTHHRKRRSQGGDDSPENTVRVCAPCHRWIHDNPRDAAAAGWLVQSWQDPVDVEPQVPLTQEELHDVAHATVTPGETCPVCKRRVPKPKDEQEAPRPKATISMKVPQDQRENGVELWYEMIEIGRELLCERMGWEATSPCTTSRWCSSRKDSRPREMPSEPIQFFVHGIPKAQGSKRHVGGGIMVEASDLAPWRKLIVDEAVRVREDWEGFQFAGPIQVRFTFWFRRPKGHYGTGRNAGQVKRTAPRWRASAPDIDKLCRAVADALTISGLILDDRLIVSMEAEKRYGNPGVLIAVQDIEEQACIEEGGLTQSPTASPPKTTPTKKAALSTGSTTTSDG